MAITTRSSIKVNPLRAGERGRRQESRNDCDDCVEDFIVDSFLDDIVRAGVVVAGIFRESAPRAQ